MFGDKTTPVRELHSEQVGLSFVISITTIRATQRKQIKPETNRNKDGGPNKRAIDVSGQDQESNKIDKRQ